MKNIIIVGAGGLAQDLYGYLMSSDHNVNLIGVLVDNIDDYNKAGIDIPYLGKLQEYSPHQNDYLLIAIGENPGRKKVITFFEEKNANFYTFIHPSSIIHHSAKIGNGTIIGPFSIVGANTIIKGKTFLNKFCNVGHDVLIEEYCIMYPYSMIGGHSHIAKNVILSTRSTIAPKLKIGNNCIVSAHTFIRKNLDDNTFACNSEKVNSKKRK